jgi:hypothetical protein
MEEVCASCLEEQALIVGKPVNWRVVLIVFGGTVCAVVILARMPRLSLAILSVLDYLHSALVRLGLLVVLSKLVLSGLFIAWGIWDSWKWRSSWNMLFWLAYVPVFIGFLFTTLTGHLIWYLAVLGGFSLVAVVKIAHRVRFARF